MKIIEIQKEAQEIIEEYRNIKIHNKRISTPYYINTKKKRNELRSLAGKGTPEEIQEETLIFGKLRGIDFNDLNNEQIREFMMKENIGIDCSGFVSHVFDKWLKKLNNGGIKKHIKFENISLYRKLVVLIRPIENMSVKVLTNKLNAEKISLNEVEVGDIIKSQALNHGDHIMLITKLEYDNNNILKSIIYTHSTPHFNNENGIKEGNIKVLDITKRLEEQEWNEDITYKGYIKDIENNGIYRLRLMKNINETRNN